MGAKNGVDKRTVSAVTFRTDGDFEKIAAK